MSGISEITDLFASLALHLRSPDLAAASEGDSSSISSSISHLNESLNPKEDGRALRVLDTALSLMCFKAPQVFKARVEYSVNTIQSLLSNSICCEVLRIREHKVLQIGAPISRDDCLKLMEALCSIIAELEGLGINSSYLLYVVARVAVSARRLHYCFPCLPVFDIKPCHGSQSTVSRLLNQLSKACFLGDQEIPFRLLAWYLDPTAMKSDVLKIMQEAKERPFLCLRGEIYQRMEWRCIISCLVLSPAMFIEADSLLHNWFLSTGLTPVLQLRIQFISSVLDLLFRPTWWGISMDVAIKLPFLHAYFPHNYHSLRILAGQISSQGFVRLVLIIDETVTLNRKLSDQLLEQAAVGISTNHKSIWATAIAFPDWFLFASALLFYNQTCQHSFQPEHTLWTAITNQLPDLESPSLAAAKYISWILIPHNESDRESLNSYLAKISESWARAVCMGRYNDEKEGYKKKHKRPKMHEKECSAPSKGMDCQKIGLWLEEFQEIFIKSSGLYLQRSVLFRKILLGILLVCSNHLTEEAFEILLHFAANSEIVSSPVGAFAVKHSMISDEAQRNKAVAGACLVFDFTASAKNLADSLFEMEQQAQGFLCIIKEKSSKYLLRCIRKLLQLKCNGDRAFEILTDLRESVLQWKGEGLDTFLHSNLLDDAIRELEKYLSS